MAANFASAASQSLAVFVIVCAVGYYYVFSPPKHPVGVPVIPFWVALLPIFSTVDQSEVFRKYLEKPLFTHGAVKLWFGGKWNVLVHSPKYVAELFKREDVYQKSGNFKKIPHSVLGAFLGDQIISNTGESWKLYQGVIKPALQLPFDHGILFENARRLAKLVAEDQSHAAGGAGIVIHGLFQKYCIQNYGQVFMRTDLKAMGPEDIPMLKLQKRVRLEVTDAIVFNFPIVDRLPLAWRKRARQLTVDYKDRLVELAANVPPKGIGEPDRLIDRLIAARKSEAFTEKQLRDNLTITFVAGHENPLLALLSTMYLLAKSPDAQRRLREEVGTIGDAVPGWDTLQTMPWLTAVVYESLRLLPPISQLITRRAATSVTLDNGKVVPEGTYIGYNCYSTNRHPDAWGQDADQFLPQRWGSTCEEVQKLYRLRRSRAEFISFHGGRRACLGEKYALMQIKATLYVLVKEFQWRLDPAWPERMSPTTPLHPRGLQLIFRKRESTS
ncbi:Cytochrome P450 family protein [Metarhizium rileyi]|uniref:Cytochrome P450 family protein n=1 Tax=Metarhizium rileyi (strain RCEF 4871) TaxID=1649241 RepID=A0A167AXI7_METRR|nr:Cytochrome P450 family protein [Metarhizium rileyi RCEF 4871]TWU79223.1 hypothetical protein ED733_008991 [Metarhizium rileyi]